METNVQLHVLVDSSTYIKMKMIQPQEYVDKAVEIQWQ